MPTLEELQEDIDWILADLWDHIQERQAIYFAAHGQFFQGLRTHAAKPADGEEMEPDFPLKPTDQAETWLDAGFELPETMPMALIINVYEAPEGHGYEVVPGMKFEDDQQRRVENIGPETWRTRAWYSEENGPPPEEKIMI